MSHSRTSPASSTVSAGAGGTPAWVWALVILLIATIVGGAAGLLAHASGQGVPDSILTGGAAFAGTVVLLLALAHFIRD